MTNKQQILFLFDDLFNKYRNCVMAQVAYQKEKVIRNFTNKEDNIDRQLMDIQRRIECLKKEYDYYRNSILETLEGEEW